MPTPRMKAPDKEIEGALLKQKRVFALLLAAAVLREKGSGIYQDMSYELIDFVNEIEDGGLL